jgi:hypothetical protein
MFHIPGTVINYSQLERLMSKKHHPEVVDVIDATTTPRKRLGSMPAGLALIKFR